MTTETIQIKPIETAWFHAVPPAPRHAITTHLPGWELILEFTKKKPEFFARFVDMYPRFILHKDIKQVFGLLSA
jgi:cystathionine gamma-synthase